MSVAPLVKSSGRRCPVSRRWSSARRRCFSRSLRSLAWDMAARVRLARGEAGGEKQARPATAEQLPRSDVKQERWRTRRRVWCHAAGMGFPLCRACAEKGASKGGRTRKT